MQSIRGSEADCALKDIEAEPPLADGIPVEHGTTEIKAAAIAFRNNAAFQADLTSPGLALADRVGAGLLRNPILSLLFPNGPKQLEATASLPFEAFC